MFNIQAELIFIVNYARSYYTPALGLLKKVVLTNLKLIKVAIFSSCNEKYIVETTEGALKLHDRIQVYCYRKYQPNYWQRKCEEDFRKCEKREFKIFPFFKLRFNKKCSAEQFENYFPDKLLRIKEIHHLHDAK